MNNDNPKISVLMPAYNTEKYIGEAIESILNQTFKDFEFIIIDDGSSDKTWEIIQKYAKMDDRVVALKNEKNLGISPTRNKLIKSSNGEYIVWQDSDDISLACRIEKQYNFMEENPEVGICGGWLQFFNKNGNLSIRKYASDDKNLRKRIFRYSPVAQPVAIVRREILEKTGLFNNLLIQAEDLDLSFRIGRYSKFANLPCVLLEYRLSPASITTRNLRENIEYTLMVRKQAVKIYGYEMNVMDNFIYITTMIFKYLPTNITYKIFNNLRSFVD